MWQLRCKLRLLSARRHRELSALALSRTFVGSHPLPPPPPPPPSSPRALLWCVWLSCWGRHILGHLVNGPSSIAMTRAAPLTRKVVSASHLPSIAIQAPQSGPGRGTDWPYT